MLKIGSQAIISKNICGFTIGDLVKIVGINPSNNTYTIKDLKSKKVIKGISDYSLFEVKTSVSINNIRLEHINDIN